MWAYSGVQEKTVPLRPVQIKSNQIKSKSNGLLGIAALMLDHNNIEVMCLQLITLRVVSVDNTIIVLSTDTYYSRDKNN